MTGGVRRPMASVFNTYEIPLHPEAAGYDFLWCTLSGANGHCTDGVLKEVRGRLQPADLPPAKPSKSRRTSYRIQSSMILCTAPHTAFLTAKASSSGACSSVFLSCLCSWTNSIPLGHTHARARVCPCRRCKHVNSNTYMSDRPSSKLIQGPWH